jgi:hypothetical protein
VRRRRQRRPLAQVYQLRPRCARPGRQRGARRAAHVARSDAYQHGRQGGNIQAVAGSRVQVARAQQRRRPKRHAGRDVPPQRRRRAARRTPQLPDRGGGALRAVARCQGRGGGCRLGLGVCRGSRGRGLCRRLGLLVGAQVVFDSLDVGLHVTFAVGIGQHARAVVSSAVCGLPRRRLGLYGGGRRGGGSGRRAAVVGVVLCRLALRLLLVSDLLGLAGSLLTHVFQHPAAGATLVLLRKQPQRKTIKAITLGAWALTSPDAGRRGGPPS